MRVVIDTSVLISAMLRDRDPEWVIDYIARHPDDDWIVSAEILVEYSDVMSRKRFNFPESLRNRWISAIQSLTTLIDLNVRVQFPRDPKDAKFLACALAAKADYLVTGDKDLKEALKLSHTKIISVAAFKQLVSETGSEH